MVKLTTQHHYNRTPSTPQWHLLFLIGVFALISVVMWGGAISSNASAHLVAWILSIPMFLGIWYVTRYQEIQDSLRSLSRRSYTSLLVAIILGSLLGPTMLVGGLAVFAATALPTSTTATSPHTIADPVFVVGEQVVVPARQRPPRPALPPAPRTVPLPAVQNIAPIHSLLVSLATPPRAPPVFA